MDRPDAFSLTGDVLRAADELGLDTDALARVLRCSTTTVESYRAGRRLIEAPMHVEMARALVKICGLIGLRVPDGVHPAVWMRSYDAALRAVPLEELTSEWGARKVLHWLQMPQPELEPACEHERPETYVPYPDQSSRPQPDLECGCTPEQPEPHTPPPNQSDRARGRNWSPWAWLAGGAAAVAAVVLTLSRR